jgi:hypothetical protein
MISFYCEYCQVSHYGAHRCAVSWYHIGVVGELKANILKKEAGINKQPDRLALEFLTMLNPGSSNINGLETVMLFKKAWDILIKILSGKIKKLEDI